MAVLVKEDFLAFEKEMLKRGWERVKKNEIVQTLKQLDLVSPYEGKPPGMEVGFTKFIIGKGVRVTIWTSYDETLGQTRDGWDVGHGVLLISNKLKYLSPDVYRTPTFFRRMLFLADLLEARARIRPDCPCCGRPMDIAWTDVNQHYWFCDGAGVHPYESIRWDEGMPERFLPFLKKKRRRTQLYNIKRRAQGLPAKGQGKPRRKKWRKRDSPP